MQSWPREEREALFDVSEAVQYVFCSPSWLIAGMVSNAWECTSCGHLLLTARQLDLHVQETHDSFFPSPGSSQHEGDSPL